MKQLATIGYEGASVGDFIASLKIAGVVKIIDVRELPLSRRKGFSKTVLADALRTEGIEYIHLRALGDPKDGRDAARAGQFAEFRRIYSKHLKTVAAQSALQEAQAMVATGGACLLCYEREPNQCHRSIVASALAGRSNLRVVHLGVRMGAGDNAHTEIGVRARGGLSQGAAAA
jgi:uncharacterized protein (DUF488 family)